MSKNSKFATISVAVFVGLFAVYLGGYQTGKSANPSTDTEQATLAIPDAPVLAQTTEPQSSGEEPNAKVTANDPKDVDFDEIRKRLDTGVYDPMLFFASAEFSDAEIKAYNRLHVLPFNPVVDEVCSEKISALDGNTITDCVRIRERDEHEYASIAIDELQSLSYSDPLAALFMGERTKDLGERIGWYLRSAALSGKPGPLIKLAKMKLPVKKLVEGERRYEPDVRGIFLQSAILRVARELGDPRAKPEEADAWLLEVGENKERITEADQAAEQMLSVINRIQAEVGVPTDA